MRLQGRLHSRRDEARLARRTRLYTEQQFRDGAIQVLVATEAAGEGINLQCCHILFNYDIPWNPNRLEQRMGRIHRYGQRLDCLIFNFVATNTIEGRVLKRLLHKLQEIRDALDDDAVFNVVGEVLPSAHVERVLRDFYAGKLGDEDLEERLLKDVDEGHFRSICHNALEGLAAKKLNLDMLIERRARAQERRVVPETIARFITECAQDAALDLKPIRGMVHTFDPGRTPSGLKRYERESGWKHPELAARYPRLSTDRDTAEKQNLEWVTPGHPLFEALRRHSLDCATHAFSRGACFHSLAHDAPARLDVYRARIVDGLGRVIHERLFTVELANDATPCLRGPDLLGNLSPTVPPDALPDVASLPEAASWLNEHALTPFLDEVRIERLDEIDRVAEHVELSLTEVLQRIDNEIGRAQEELDNEAAGAEGRLAQAEARHAEVLARRERRREELGRQRAVTLQGVERLASALILPHPERETLDVRRLRPHPETEMTAMCVVMEHEAARGCQVYDVHEKNLGYDITSLDLQSGELRLIERRPDRQHPPHPKRTPRGRGPARLLLAVRGHRVCNRPESPAADPGPRQVPVARGHQGRPLLPERKRPAATDGDTGDGTRLQCGAQTMSEQVLDQTVLDEIIRRIVAVAQPEKIILFGSAARGEMGRHSDVDLLIVKDGPDRRRTATTIYCHLHGVDAAVDLIVVTPADVDRYQDSHALIIKPALREGRVVYESS